MFKPKFLLGTACALGIFATPAAAQSLQGLYMRGDVGWSMSTNANMHDRAPDGVIPTTLSDIGSGWAVGGGVGMGFAPGFRGDLTYTYRGGYSLDELTGGASPATFRADFHAHAVMATGYWDIDVGYPTIVPFLGAGIGWAETSISNLSKTVGGTTTIAPGGSTDNFAWQGTAGVGFTVAPGIILDVFYRYFDAGHFASATGNVISGGIVVGTYHGAEGALHVHEFGASIRFPLTL